MAKSSIEKTNVMRLLDQKKVPYTPHTYPHGDDAVDGVTVAQMTGTVSYTHLTLPTTERV